MMASEHVYKVQNRFLRHYPARVRPAPLDTGIEALCVRPEDP